MFSGPELFLQDLAVILISALIAGLLCARIGLSPVVGYLTAGLIVGTPEIAFPYVSDQERLQLIAQLGVVFLMFSIGLQFQLKRIRELGAQVVLATALTALMIFTAAQTASGWLGVGQAGSVVIAGLFMNSSSAIISKVLRETRLHHERPGRVALGITLMEDVVAIIMIAVVGAYVVSVPGESVRTPIAALGLLVGFVLIVGLSGMIFVPRILQMVTRRGKGEMLSILIGGLVLLTALAAIGAGFSLALGAFLFGVIVSETRQRSEVDRAFQALKDIFLTVFFVTVGMMVNIREIPDVFGWILLGTAGALLGRSTAAFFALVLTGEQPRRAAQAAVCLTPIGEFGFILAGIAVAGNIFSSSFQAIVMGTAFLTSIVSPLLATHSARITRFLEPGRNPIVDNLYSSYRKFLDTFIGGPPPGILWKLLRKRLIQSAIELVIISTILVFSGEIYNRIEESLLEMVGISDAVLRYIFWLVITAVCFVPMVAVWRNLSAASMILAEYADARHQGDGKFIRVWMLPIRTLLFAGLAVWLWSILPDDVPRHVLLLGIGLCALLVIPLGWRRMVRLHSQLEITLNENLRQSQAQGSRAVFEKRDVADWNFELEEFELPDGSVWSGRTIEDTRLRKETGCSVVGVERHGVTLSSIGPRTHLFPGDNLLLMGSLSGVTKARAMLAQTGESELAEGALHDMLLETLEITAASQFAGKTMTQLQWPKLYGVNVLAIMRGGESLPAVEAGTQVIEGDILLLLGRTKDLEKLKHLNSISAQEI